MGRESINEPLIQNLENSIEDLEPLIDSYFHDLTALKRQIFGQTEQKSRIKLHTEESDTTRFTIRDTDEELRITGKNPRNMSQEAKRQTITDYQDKITELGSEWKTYKYIINKADKKDFTPQPKEDPLQTLDNLYVGVGDKVLGLETYLQSLSDIAFQKHHGQKPEFSKEDIEKRENRHNTSRETFPFIAGLQETVENIQIAREDAFSNLEPQTEYTSQNTSKPKRPEIPAFEPEGWREIYFFDDRNLHEWLENEEPSTKENVQHEYPLHFTSNPLTPPDRSLQPDALEDLYVHEFKQPDNRRTPEMLESKKITNKSQEDDLRQINTYLNELNLPAGILIYATNGSTNQYVVERSEQEIPPTSNIHRVGDYNFEQKISENL